nr:early nodulin-like protein 2 [Ipomoea batatas]
MYTHSHRHPLIILVFLVSLHFNSSTSYAVPSDISGRDKGPFGVLKSDEMVLEVSKEDYEKCNTKNPIKKMDYGNSMFQFGQSGTIYIISGNQESCEKGQKFIIVVPPMRNNPPYHPPKANQETPAPSVGTPGTTPSSSKGSLATQSSPPSTKGSLTITPYRHAPKAVSPKGFVGSTSPISYSPSRVPPKRFTPTFPQVVIPPPKSSISSSPNTLSSSHAPVKAPTPVAHLQPPSHTATTSISPSIVSKIPSSLSPTTPHAPLSSNMSPLMSPQGSRIIPSSTPTPLTAPSSNKSPVTSPQGPSNIAPIPSGSAIGMATTPTTLILASVLALSISVALQELFTIYH